MWFHNDSNLGVLTKASLKTKVKMPATTSRMTITRMTAAYCEGRWTEREREDRERGERVSLR